MERRLGRRPDAHGVHMLPLDASAVAYVSKIGDEVTRQDLKGGARQPWSILDAVADGEAWAVARWLEYDSATRGRRALVWSDGLRADVLPDVEDLTDEEIAALEVEGEVVALVPAETWVQLMRPRSRGAAPPAVMLLADVEAACRSGDPLAAVVAASLARLSTPGPG